MFWWNASSSLLPWYPMLFFLEHFNRALTIMNQVVSGTLQPGAKENVAYLTNTERRYSLFGFVLLSDCSIDWFVLGKWFINSFRYRDSCIFQSIFEIITISFADNSIMKSQIVFEIPASKIYWMGRKSNASCMKFHWLHQCLLKSVSSSYLPIN